MRLFAHLAKKPRGDLGSTSDLQSLASEQLMALMRHEAHRIEKSIYNDIFRTKYAIYHGKWERLASIFAILEERGIDANEPTVLWAKQIAVAFEQLEEQFIRPNSRPAEPYVPTRVDEFQRLVATRRSVRVWAAEQPEQDELSSLGRKLVDVARWAPNSGNRQPWRFKILIEPEHKELLRGLKEQHCIAAPLLIYVGMDTRYYGGLTKEHTDLYIDSGAAIMQMVLAAHSAGFGVCWNHFAKDLVASRKKNRGLYERFAGAMNIPSWVTPIAIVAVGRPAFIPPAPPRRPVDDLLL